MTLEEAQNILRNKKVYSKGKNKELQEKLFELGIVWKSRGAKVDETSCPYFYIRGLSLTWDVSKIMFNIDEMSEISLEEVLNIKIDGACTEMTKKRTPECGISEKSYNSLLDIITKMNNDIYELKEAVKSLKIKHE